MRWNIAPYFIVDDRGLFDQPYGCRDFEIEGYNGYRLCFGHSID
ncbi:MAG TPA: hypothetical protein VE714_02805 [Gemmatimonadales bacterium]|jgi:hypothetical protein|nr:hypothetical protein [Gemmatimonadales bacterium]